MRVEQNDDLNSDSADSACQDTTDDSNLSDGFVCDDVSQEGETNCSTNDTDHKADEGWLRRKVCSFAQGVGASFPLSTSTRREFSVRVSLHLAVQLVVGSFCCMAAAIQVTERGCLLLRIVLALVSVGGFIRLFGPRRTPLLYRRTKIPMLCIANYVKLAIFAVAATLAATAATLAASVAMMVTGATFYWRAACSRERRRWYANVAGFVQDLLELGALLLQMILMTQVCHICFECNSIRFRHSIFLFPRSAALCQRYAMRFFPLRKSQKAHKSLSDKIRITLLCPASLLLVQITPLPTPPVASTSLSAPLHTPAPRRSGSSGISA